MYRDRFSGPGGAVGNPAVSVLLVTHNGRGPIAIRRHADYTKVVLSAQKAFRSALEGVPLVRLYLKAKIPGLVEKEPVQISEELWPDIASVLHCVSVEVEELEDISPENAHDSTYHTPPHDPVTDSSQEDPALAALLSLYPAPRPSPNTICPRSSSFASRPPNTTQHPEPLSASGPQTSRSSPTPITRFMGTPLLPTPRSMVGTSSPPEDTPSPHILPSLAANDLCIPGPLEPPVLTVKFMDGTVPPMGIAGIEMKSLTGARVLEIVAARTGLDVENCCLAQGGWSIDHNQNLHDFGVSPGDQIYFRRNV